MRRPWLRGEIGVGAEDAELGEGRRLGGEEGDLDAVPLACGGGGGGPVRAVGDVAPYAEKDMVGVGGADVGQGRWVQGLLLFFLESHSTTKTSTTRTHTHTLWTEHRQI